MSARCLNMLRHGKGGGLPTIRSTAVSSFSTLSVSSSTMANNVSGSGGSAREFRVGPPPLGSKVLRSPTKPHGWLFLFHQTRWKSGKMGHAVESLKEMAHRPEREAAQERRKKKKERKAAKKAGGKQQQQQQQQQQQVSETGDTEHEQIGDDDEDDLIFADVDDDVGENLDEHGEPTLPDTIVVRNKMDAVVDRFRESLKSIRGAEPTADMFDDVMVQAYGAPTPLNAVAQVVITSPTLAQLTCFDPTVAKDVVKAVQLTLELNPQLEEGGGGNIKVPLPRVSMEVREKLSKSVKKRAESCKQRLRGVRRKAMDVVKKGKDGKLPGISKDEAFASAKEIEAASETASETIKTIVAEKMDSIMAV